MRASLLIRATAYLATVGRLSRPPSGRCIGDAEVLSLDADTIRYRVVGSVDVTLIAGSKSDGAEFDENFRYDCSTSASVTAPTIFDSEETEMKVDTGSWTGKEAEGEAKE